MRVEEKSAEAIVAKMGRNGSRSKGPKNSNTHHTPLSRVVCLETSWTQAAGRIETGWTPRAEGAGRHARLGG